jgi:hypothetical protein
MAVQLDPRRKTRAKKESPASLLMVRMDQCPSHLTILYKVSACWVGG